MQDQNLLETNAEAEEATVTQAQETDTAQQQEQQAQEPQDSPEDIQEAERMGGWVPKDQWRGKPEDWKPAKEFVRRGREILPIVQKRERELRDKLTASERKIADLEQSFDERARRMEGMARVALDRQREQIIGAYESAKRKAAADGDLDAYDRLDREGRQAVADFNPEKEAEKFAPAKKQEQQQQQVPEPILNAIQDWRASNTWFDRDPVLNRAMSMEHELLLQEKPGLDIGENLEEAAQRVRARYPDKFGVRKTPAQTQQAHSPSVEGGGRQSTGAGRERGWESLPPEAKQAGSRYIERDKLFLPKDADTENPTEAHIKAARAAYAKEYWSQEQ